MIPSPAIAPPISVESFDTNPSVYTSPKNNKNTYIVEIWNEFSVLCVSSGDFSGRVSWSKKGSKGNSLICLCT